MRINVYDIYFNEDTQRYIVSCRMHPRWVVQPLRLRQNADDLAHAHAILEHNARRIIPKAKRQTYLGRGYAT